MHAASKSGQTFGWTHAKPLALATLSRTCRNLCRRDPHVGNLSIAHRRRAHFWSMVPTLCSSRSRCFGSAWDTFHDFISDAQQTSKNSPLENTSSARICHFFLAIASRSSRTPPTLQVGPGLVGHSCDSFLDWSPKSLNSCKSIDFNDSNFTT